MLSLTKLITLKLPGLKGKHRVLKLLRSGKLKGTLDPKTNTWKILGHTALAYSKKFLKK